MIHATIVYVHVSCVCVISGHFKAASAIIIPVSRTSLLEICKRTTFVAAGHLELVQVPMESPSGAPWQVESNMLPTCCDMLRPKPQETQKSQLGLPKHNHIKRFTPTDNSLLRAQQFLTISLNFILNHTKYIGWWVGPSTLSGIVTFTGLLAVITQHHPHDGCCSEWSPRLEVVLGLGSLTSQRVFVCFFLSFGHC